MHKKAISWQNIINPVEMLKTPTYIPILNPLSVAPDVKQNLLLLLSLSSQTANEDFSSTSYDDDLHSSIQSSTTVKNLNETSDQNKMSSTIPWDKKSRDADDLVMLPEDFFDSTTSRNETITEEIIRTSPIRYRLHIKFKTHVLFTKVNNRQDVFISWNDLSTIIRSALTNSSLTELLRASIRSLLTTNDNFFQKLKNNFGYSNLFNQDMYKSSEESLKISSIAYDIINTRYSSYSSPKQSLLGNELYHHVRSSHLLDVMNRYGHTCSYETIELFVSIPFFVLDRIENIFSSVDSHSSTIEKINAYKNSNGIRRIIKRKTTSSTNTSTQTRFNNERNVQQTAYQIQIKSNTQQWDSGKIHSSQSIHVPFINSDDLQSLTHYQIRLRVWTTLSDQPSSWTNWITINIIQILRDHYDSIRASYSKTGLAKLAYHYGDWVPPTPQPMTNVYLIASFAFLHDVSVLVNISQIIGFTNDTQSYTTFYQQLAEEFHRVFFTTSSGYYADGMQAAQILALALPNVVPANVRSSVFEHLIQDIQQKGNHVSTGIVSTAQLFPLLSDNGQHDLAVELVSSVTYPSYGYMFNNPYENATTMWELWDAPMEGPGMNSRNHHMFSSIGAWFYSHLGGIDFQSDLILIRPRMLSEEKKHLLSKVDCQLSTLYGLVHVAYTRDQRDTLRNSIVLRVSIPTNAKAQVMFEPLFPHARCVSLTEGQKVICYEN
ncbi:hypothetical protein I4U23_029452 [Adineta vaga]|nr:hypothetical protein I4U23_029452 [Adineta vaga]